MTLYLPVPLDEHITLICVAAQARDGPADFVCMTPAATICVDLRIGMCGCVGLCVCGWVCHAATNRAQRCRVHI